MATYSPFREHAAELTGRRGECHVLDRLIDAVRAGGSRALVVPGERGVVKTALSRLDGVDAGHFTWEHGADEYAALVTSRSGAGDATTSGAPS